MKNYLGRNFKCLGKWNRVEIDKEDEEKLQQELREKNNNIMKECLLDARELLNANCRSFEVRTILASALFNKRAPQSYTIYQIYLDNLVQEMKRKACKEEQ